MNYNPIILRLSHRILKEVKVVIKFVLATHGNFATGIEQSIQMIAGEFENLEAISCYTEENFNLNREVERILRENKGDIVVVTDIFGGSVNNAFMEKIEGNKNLYVISGLNLSLILELLGEQDSYTTTEELIRESLENSAEAVHYCNDDILTSIDDDNF